MACLPAATAMEENHVSPGCAMACARIALTKLPISNKQRQVRVSSGVVQGLGLLDNVVFQNDMPCHWSACAQAKAALFYFLLLS
jgi:hypothetical protein